MITSACGPHQSPPRHRHLHRAAAIQWLAVTILLWSPPSQAANRPESTAPASPPLRDQINSLLARGVATMPPEKCDDETFIRRSSLDFRGLTPSASEIHSFLADSRPDKRVHLVDTFIADPHHERHLATVLDVMLMERRPEKHVKTAEWKAWLRQKVANRTPWDQLVQQILSAEGTENADAPPRGAARWILDREAEPNALTRDTARLFLGMDLACAQCHDHPRIADYWQRDYHGLLAFFTRTFLFQPDPAKPAFVAERAEGEATFTSVFTQVAGQARPSLPQGNPIDEPTVATASLWSVPPDEKNPSTRPVPTQSRKKSLLNPLTSSRDFAVNAANRFWAALLGRGIIDPVDLRHSANPPAADALLDALADGLVTLQYNLSAYWREIALSEAYQAAYDPPPPPATSAATPNTDENPNAAPSAAAAAAATAAATAATEAERTARDAESHAREVWEPLQLTAQKLDEEASAATKAVVEARILAEAAAAAAAQAARDLAAQTALIPVLEAAARQCAEAAQTVLDAPELTEASTLIQARLATAHQERETLAATAASQEAEHAAKTTALAAATEKAAAITQQAAAAHTAAQTAWDTTASAAETARTTRDTARRLNRDAARATTMAAWHTAAHQEKAAASRLQTAEITARTLATTTASLEAATSSLPNDTELAAVLARLKTRQSAATTAIETSRTEATTASSAATTAAESMVSSLADSFAIARLTPLTPEQLCWSILQATGTLDQLHTQSAREWDEKNPAPATETTVPDPTHITTRTQAINTLTEEKVRPHEEQFVRLFSNGPGSPQTDFFATSDQALYFENAGSVRLWTMPSSGNLAEQLVSTTEPATLTSTLWLALLNRPPSQEEIGQATHLITSRPAEEKAAVVSDLMWALLTSAEFRFKH